jgi:hypothetical protein
LRSVLLRAAATALTLLSVVVSASYVTSHLKNTNAPLKPAVRTSTVTPITSTYAS